MSLGLRRCDRCSAPVWRRTEERRPLCTSCLAGERAVDQASRAEGSVRRALYGLRGNVEVVGRADSGPLRIALLAPPWLSVPPTGYGGIEAMLALLADALVAEGHDVTLLAAPGSRSSAEVVELLDRVHGDQMGASVVEADHVGRAFAYLERAALEGRPYDVLHDNSGWVALAMADRLDVPVLHTVHGPFDDENAYRFYSEHGHKAAIACISSAQAAMSPDGLDVAAVVPNPVDVDAWPTDVPKDDYLLWVGRFTREKGPHRAIRVAQASGRRLILAGPVQPGQESFFANSIEPHLDGDQIRYIGEVGGWRKQELFAGARALLVPISWPEPFGMVMVEAMAAGTPVIAFPEGSVPEVVEAGRSGLLVDDVDEMASAVADVDQLDPSECRASARERFSPERVARQYEAVYRAISTPARPTPTDDHDRELAIAA